MTFEVIPGTIYSAFFPFSGISDSKRRPVLVLSGKDDNGDVRVAVITKTPADPSQCVSLEDSDYRDTPLKHPGNVRTDKVFALHSSRLEKPVAVLNGNGYERVLRKLILMNIPELAALRHGAKPFEPGVSIVPPSGKLIGSAELQHMVEASLDGWLTTGRFNDAFEKRLASFLGAKHVLTTNSGSSANLLALAALTSHKLGDKALKQGDEIITVAAGFPTTVNPAIQYGLVPVFVDVNIPTYNIDPMQLEAAVSDRTRAIMIAHTLGNPFCIDEVMRVARKYDLWVIEDCCDALGSLYTMSSGETKLVGSFGDVATLSFYPAHHITMGEGGAVYTNNGQLKLLLESFRDWGRDCFCAPGKDNSCKKRFCWKLGQLPYGFDHKYTYSHAGYNLKISDMQAACGLAQLDRLEYFIESRRRNFKFLYDQLKAIEEHVILPEATPNSTPSWFGFPITIRNHKDGIRASLQQHLDKSKIGSRLIFAGNLSKQPYFENIKYRVCGELKNTDIVMENSLWVGVHPSLSEEALEYMSETIKNFFE